MATPVGTCASIGNVDEWALAHYGGRVPTLPSGDIQPHRFREVAESFGDDADRYARARPDYPTAMIDRIVAAAPGPEVLDVGCGTGIAARQFQAAGCRVLGVEPDARMAEVATDVRVEVSAIETWDPAGRTFDAVVAGQAWHWVDPVVGAAKAAEALRPGGLLAVFWNVFLPPREVADAFAEVYRKAAPDLPFTPWATPAFDAYTSMFAKAEDGIRAAGAFGEPERWRTDWARPYTRDEWLEQVPTHGGHSRFLPDKQTEILTGLGAALDDLGGGFTMGYATVAVAASAHR
jgi:SAM-dependent methyltransferase